MIREKMLEEQVVELMLQNSRLQDTIQTLRKALARMPCECPQQERIAEGMSMRLVIKDCGICEPCKARAKLKEEQSDETVSV